MPKCVNGEQGSASLELALVTPVLLLVLLLIVGLGRLGETRAQIDGASAQAARAASIARSPVEATNQADQSLSAAMSAGMKCPEMTTSIDVSGFAPGGLVVVELSCRVELANMTGVSLPGSKLLHIRAVAVVDTYRGVG